MTDVVPPYGSLEHEPGAGVVSHPTAPLVVAEPTSNKAAIVGASLVSGFTALGATGATIVSLALHSNATPLVVIFGYGAVAVIGRKIFSSDSGERQRKAYERAEVLGALKAQTISADDAEKLLRRIEGSSLS